MSAKCIILSHFLINVIGFYANGIQNFVRAALSFDILNHFNLNRLQTIKTISNISMTSFDHGHRSVYFCLYIQVKRSETTYKPFYQDELIVLNI